MHDIFFRRILQFGECRTDIHLDKFGSAFAYLYVVGTAHVALDVFCQVITCNLYAAVADNAAKGDDCDFGCTATYIDNHVAFGGFHVKADTEGGGHWFV